MDDSFMKKPCKHCPFRRDVLPYLHPERAEEIAMAASNPYNSFACHKTLDHDDDGTFAGEESKECAGFLTMRAHEDDRGIPTGFEPSWELCYTDSWDMEYAYRQAWEAK